MDLGRRGIVLCSENKGADQLRGNPTAELRLYFRICENRFSYDTAQMLCWKRLSKDSDTKICIETNMATPHFISFVAAISEKQLIA